MSEEPLGPELTALEAALSGLVPRTGLERDRVLYCAGQASVRGRRWLWPTVAAAWCGVALGLGAALVAQRGAVPAERVLLVEVPAPAPPGRGDEAPAPPRPAVAAAPADWQPKSAGDYLHLRQQVVRFGAEALPEPPADAPPDRPVTVERIFDTPASLPNATSSTRRTTS